MIRFDVTQASAWRHRSGLMRVSTRLREELGPAAVPARWPGDWAAAGADDWLLTVELFSEAERPGIRAFLDRRPCRLAAIFHDAIPLKLPQITWPASVARHPEYLKLLAKFDRIWAVSAASREELLGFWAWQGITAPPPVEVLALGADAGGARVGFAPAAGGEGSRLALEGSPSHRHPVDAGSAPAGPRAKTRPMLRLLSVGILEPRKNQELLLDVCAELWTKGMSFGLDIVGRVNPHFGKPIEQRIRRMQRRWPGLRYHQEASDQTVEGLYAGARAAVFPTLAEGCGLPLLESLWRGVPCVGSDVPSLVENAAGGGCLTVPVGDRAAWKGALKAILTDDALHARLVAEAVSRRLPTWAEAAATLRSALIPQGRGRLG
jgi:glycosyltransferase involved in cell wall biosynthesis